MGIIRKFIDCKDIPKKKNYFFIKYLFASQTQLVLLCDYLKANLFKYKLTL